MNSQEFNARREALKAVFSAPIVCTATVAEKFATHRLIPFLRRHFAGDWGEVPESDAKLNDEALLNGERILSAYTLDGQKVWIITEADRSVTTVMFPSDY